MADIIKKVFYLREDQVQEINDVICRSYKDGKRRFNESSFCRVAVDLFLSLNMEIEEFSSEEELLEACKSLVKKQTRRTG